MALIDIRCTSCDQVSTVNRPIADWPSTPPCPLCGSPSIREWILGSPPSKADPVVVYQMPDGSFRFPGARESSATRAYDAQGGTRLELRGWQEVRPFERAMNAHEKTKMLRQFERKERARQAGASLRRSESRRVIASFTSGGQAFARTLLDHLDRQPGPRPPGDPGFRVEAYSENRSNREESRDDRGRRRND